MARRSQLPLGMQPGEIIDGKYVVERRLGEGGMGLVVAARELATGELVAIKVLRANVWDEQHVQRFLREVRGMVQLDTDHVARIFDHGECVDGRPYMVMELLAGPDLDTVLAAGTLPAPLAADYVIQACRGLAQAHALGIVHRDIKPANLMLATAATGERIIKLVDFGIATASTHDPFNERITAAHVVIGSITYMSPEQLDAETVDTRSDIWSLGITLYELISGHVPFDAESFALTALAITTDPHPPLAVEPGLAAIVDRCLAKKPADRFATVDDLAAALAPFAEQLAMPTRPVPVVEVAAPRGFAIPKRAWLVATMLVLFGFAAIAAAGGEPLPAKPAPARAEPTITVDPIIELPIEQPGQSPQRS